jgi:hypothetical protein
MRYLLTCASGEEVMPVFSFSPCHLPIDRECAAVSLPGRQVRHSLYESGFEFRVPRPVTWCRPSQPK